MPVLLNATPFEQKDEPLFERLGWRVERAPRTGRTPAQSGGWAQEACRVAAGIPEGSDVLISGQWEYCVELAVLLLAKRCQLYKPVVQEGKVLRVEELAASRNSGLSRAQAGSPRTATEAPAGAPVSSPLVAAAGGSAEPEPQASHPHSPRSSRTGGEVLNDAQSVVRRTGQRDSEPVRLLREELHRTEPARLEEFDGRIAEGMREHGLLQELRASAVKLGANHAQVRGLLARVPHYLRKVAIRIINEGDAQHRRAPRPSLSSVHAAGEHRMRCLAPLPEWVLLIDETGDKFEAGTALQSGAHRKGRFVGILVPGDAALPGMPRGFHATRALDGDLDRHLQTLLDAPVGVFGLTISELPAGAGHRWAHGVQEIIQWALRLVALQPGQPSRIHVLIEERAPYGKGDWKATAEEMLRHYSESDPDRAARIVPDIKVVKKDDHPWLAYADLVSFSWGSPAAASRHRVRQSGLLGACLQEGNSRELRRAWDRLAMGRNVDGAAWRSLLADSDAQEEESMTSELLRRLQDACRKDLPLWTSYLEACRAHLESKRTDLRAMGVELDWLESCRPEGGSFTKPMKLTWLTIQLAQANHMGAIEFAQSQNLEQLALDILDEDARLVCLADLHRAVSLFNRFDFTGAERALSRWASFPAMAPGLQMWGRVQSSLGQAAAFQGRRQDASRLFADALSAFERLSDPALRQAELIHTRGYCAVVAMDDDGIALDAARVLVESVTGPLGEAVQRLAVSAGDADKYAHHLLLRFLFHRAGPESAQRYLETSKGWQTGFGHPWPLIQLYRAALLRPSEPDAALRHLNEGILLALDQSQGPRDRLIGAVLAVIGRQWGREWPEAEDVLGRLETELPNALDRIRSLRAAMASPREPKAILVEALPFRFR